MIGIKKEHPSLPKVDIEESAAAIRFHESGQVFDINASILADQLRRVRVADSASDGQFFSVPVDLAEITKKLVAELILRLHPDRLELHEIYEKLSDNQKKQLKAYWEKLIRLKKEAFSDEALNVLTRMKNEVEEIFKNAGIEVAPALIIKGETLHQKLIFLREENQYLAKTLIDLDMDILFKNREAEKYLGLLSSPDCWESHKEGLREEITNLRSKHDILEVEFSVLFDEIS